MAVQKTEVLAIGCSADVTRVRQRVRLRCRELDFSLVDQTKMVTAASELARNTLDYGGGGTVCLDALSEGMRLGLRLTFEDRGPGIPDIELALQSGYTTGSRVATRQAMDWAWGWAAPGGSSRNSKSSPISEKGRASSLYGGNSLITRRSIILPVTEASQVGDARRRAGALAGTAGFDETTRGKVALVVTEIANNLVQHAVNGELLLQIREQEGIGGLEILALDKGPGMKNVGQCLVDGFSTEKTPGNGLGACRRGHFW